MLTFRYSHLKVFFVKQFTISFLVYSPLEIRYFTPHFRVHQATKFDANNLKLSEEYILFVAIFTMAS